MVSPQLQKQRLSWSKFQSQIEQEFCQGSGIAIDLFQANIQIVSDTEQLPGGEVCYPIHEALNWKNVVRFGKQARETEFAALFAQESGECWQAKLSNPRRDPKKQKAQKYEAPTGNGSRAYLPMVPVAIRRRISQKYSVSIPTNESFWEWLERNPQVPIIWTEGGKKGLTLLSCGAVAIALYGCYGGYRSKDELGNPAMPQLISDVQRFCQPERKHYLAFDQDADPKTRRRVALALSRFGDLLTATGGEVLIASWNPQHGKGVDDLIVSQGVEAWESAYGEALLLTHWKIWQRLENRLTYKVSLQVESRDLSKLELACLPERGIIAIESAKGTGKTKLISQQIKDSEKALAGGHRIALMRNLSERLGLDYLGDVDKAKGQFINGSSYTLRLGLCVDSLLSLDPNKFAGCDLILDEVVQVLRHLLTSSTCAKEGKRPALLARLREIIRVARRLIVADADLNDATLRYLQELRDEPDEPVFLIRNLHQSSGYPVRFIDSCDRSVISAELMQAIKVLKPGEQLFVATDSKSLTKQLLRLINHECPEKLEQTLVLNSDTSGGEQEREFIQFPDQVVERGNFQIYICSPSVATGVSIETQGKFTTIYGIFSGVSSTDADVAQALGRVREPVQRVVWCAKRGINFSKVSRSTNQREVKKHLQQQVSATVRLIRSSLREDAAGAINAYNWDSDAHLELYCQIAAEQNQAMQTFRDSVLVRLKFEGNQVTVENRASDPALKQMLTAVRQAQLEFDAKSILAAEDLIYAEVLALEQKEFLSPEERLAIAKFHLKDFYTVETLTLDQILWDAEGRRRGEILSLEAQLSPTLAIDRCVRSLDKQMTWKAGFSTWDLSTAELKRQIRELIGLNELIEKMRQNWHWTRYELKLYADRARALTQQIKIALNFTITAGMSDTQIIHQLLSQLGIKIAMLKWSRSVEGHKGEKLRVYSLDFDHWEQVQVILERRQVKRQASASDQGDFGSPSDINKNQSGGDPTALASSLTILREAEASVDPEAVWFEPENLLNLQEVLEEMKDDPIALAQYLRGVPRQVLDRLGFAS
jgi:hypothetical protein